MTAPDEGLLRFYVTCECGNAKIGFKHVSAGYYRIYCKSCNRTELVLIGKVVS